MLYVPVVAGRGRSTWGVFVREDPELVDGGLFTLSDALNSPEITVESSATFALADSLTSDRTAIPLTNVIVWSDALGGNLNVSALTNIILWHDDLGQMELGTIADTMIWADALTVEFSTLALTDNITWTGTLSVDFGVSALFDSVSWFDTLTSALALIGELSNTVLWSDSLTDIDAVYRVVVINADTGAVSEFVFSMPIFGIAQYDGNLYVASTAGLYVLDAITDENDVDVEWEIATGFTTLGTDERKRVRDINILNRTEGKTVVKVTTARIGDKVEDWFLLPTLNRISTRDGVVKIGQGISSVYWKIGAAGTGPAEIDQTKVTVLPLARRR